ncbi:phosphatase 2C [Thalictrum thalictroides]|uniref:Phosphatase 2C n=1 Tax=Thalictrum thalictroides TaxID=46969 RepID=A0A7J6VAC3_THATH|nr:phosphatase 2C [Thalictrum thalictroides]
MKFLLAIVLGFLILLQCCSSISSSSSLLTTIEVPSSTCLKVYEESGAPGVFQSTECSRWNLSTEDSIKKQMENCQQQSFKLQGRRKYQEDRTFCALDLKIPFHGRAGTEEVTAGIVAVFDGHNGAEASEMSAKLLLDYFSLHVHFLRGWMYSLTSENSIGNFLHKGEPDSISDVLNRVEKYREHGWDLGRFKWTLPEIFDGSFHKEILKESLLRAIHDIDATFSKEAFRTNLTSGSTAAAVLIVDNQILVSNVGDSKAILCSEKFQSPQEIRDTLLKHRQKGRAGDLFSLKRYHKHKMAASLGGVKHFAVKELTRDHHPDRDDERSRIESAGGFVEEWGVPRVNGELAVSRSIGDVSFKRYGVISVPEVTDWQHLTANDTYLVAASDGIFERMTTQDVCDLLWDVHTHSIETTEFSSSCMRSLSECIVNTAFENGSMDNMAAVVIPLKSTDNVGSTLHEDM